MATEIPTAYDPQAVERDIYEYWMAEGVFAPRIKEGQEPFCIVIPPPNVTGILHMGHALDASIQDLLTRRHRMLGHAALWLPGVDHAGIATQNVVEKRLAEEGLTRHDLGREAFIERVWAIKEAHHNHIREQLKRFGASVDWSRERFTLDERYARAVREAFVLLYEQGLIYRGARITNWCPRCTTSLSDLEVEHEDTQGHLWHMRYRAADGGPGVVVATTRPETMLGDTAVAVHPEDERYKSLVGSTVILPLMERQIPVVADEHVDMAFGTGAVKVTPAHDPNDFEIGLRHSLDTVNVIGDDGTMSEEARQYAGLDRYEARRRIVADLEELGLLECIEDHSHSVGHCSRCNSTIEPLISVQWFVRMEPLADKALQAVRSGEVRFVPERWAKVECDWLESMEDWCISRQLWWGHPIPVWHCSDCGEMTCTREDPTECAHCHGTSISADEDVLDTWFSSGLWPFATLGWPEQTEDLACFFPTSVLVTAYDIIFFWVARMITMAEHIVDQRPFDEVFIHGLVRDRQGRKISKSLGNNIDPIELIDTYGADAMRFALIQLITHGQDLKYSDERIMTARNFANKLWNAARFVMMNLDETAPEVDLGAAELTLADRWILSRHNAGMIALNKELDEYNLAQGADILWEHVWDEFCDWYLELCKPDLYGDRTPERKAIVQSILRDVLGGILRALHPFMPFVTEAIWRNFAPDAGSICVAPYPRGSQELVDPEAEAQMRLLQAVISTIRNLRAVVGLPRSQTVRATLLASPVAAAVLDSQADGIRALAGVGELRILPESSDAPAGALGDVAEGVRVFLHIEGDVDIEGELQRLQTEIAKLEKLNAQCRGKLENDGFVSRAPAEVVELERQRLAENTAAIEKLEQQAGLMRGLLS